MVSFNNPDNLFKTIKNVVQSEIKKLRPSTVWKVTDVNTEKYTCNIRDLNFKTIEYTDVPILGFGLGNFKGVLKYPEVDDLVLVTFLGGEDPRPVVLGTLFDSFTQNPDNIPLIDENELFLTNKTLGSIIFINKDNEIVMKVTDVNSDLDGGARLKLSPDGSFKLFNKDNYGIEVDKDGAMVLRGVTIDHTTTAGVF